MSSNVRKSTSMLLINNSTRFDNDENGELSDLMPIKLVGDQVRLQ